MAERHNTELRLAVVAIILITLAYIFMTLRLGAMPKSSGLEGHLLGAFGLVFMLMTEILYSARKRAKRPARWGRLESWLKFHTFTGLVGPFMVLLHTSWKFNGLAGIVTLLTLVVAFSGIIGRYIYTAVPRSGDGAEIDSATLEDQIASTEIQLQAWLITNAELSHALPRKIISLPRIPRSAWGIMFGRTFSRLDYRRHWWSSIYHLKSATRAKLRELDTLLTRRQELRYQVASLVFVRRVLASWHSFHVPLGIALFTTAFIHIGVAIYYVTLAR